jgi:hypothetical protein
VGCGLTRPDGGHGVGDPSSSASSSLMMTSPRDGLAIANSPRSSIKPIDKMDGFTRKRDRGVRVSSSPLSRQLPTEAFECNRLHQ